MTLSKKIDFAVIIKVKNATPNGDPLNGNRPRTDFQSFGEITDVCLKRKIRDRLQDTGESIFVQSDEKKTDGMPSLANRAKDTHVGLGADAFNAKKSNKDDTAQKACKKWLDVRSFGQVFAFSGSESSGVSIAVRGPVTIQSAYSIEPVNITSIQITKSVSGEGDGNKKSSDTMGMKHRVDSGIYVTYGSMSPQLAERTGFSDDDAQKIKAVLTKLFEGDESSARPAGSMEVLKVIWWEQAGKTGKYSSAKVHGSLKVHSDGSYEFAPLDGLKPEEIDGY